MLRINIVKTVLLKHGWDSPMSSKKNPTEFQHNSYMMFLFIDRSNSRRANCSYDLCCLHSFLQWPQTLQPTWRWTVLASWRTSWLSAGQAAPSSRTSCFRPNIRSATDWRTAMNGRWFMVLTHTRTPRKRERKKKRELYNFSFFFF